MWRERRWKDLLLLIDWLPRNSAYMEAMSDDEDVASDVLSRSQRDKKPGVPRPRISEWSPELEKATDIVDRLGEVMQAVIAAAGGKPPKVRPQPRPRTAIDKLREQQRRQHHRKVVSRVLIQQPDGSLVPVSLTPPPKRSATRAAVPQRTPGRPTILPGEDPFRMKSSRRTAPPAGAAE